MRRAVALLGEVEENPLALTYDDMHARLAEALPRLNGEFHWLLPLSAPGEFPEFVGVLPDLASVYPVARHLAEALHPLVVRVGASQGEVAEATLESADPEQLDGPAFDAAAELLYRARRDDRMIVIRGAQPEADILANALFLVLYRDLRGWTERQAEVVRLYRVHGRQQAVAQALGISQQSVSSSLSAAGWKTLSQAEDALQRVYGIDGVSAPVARKG